MAARARRQAPLARRQRRRCIGAHLHDVDGIGDHRAPGNGDVQWDYIRDGLPASALRVFEINQTQPPAALASAIPFLRERGDLGLSTDLTGGHRCRLIVICVPVFSSPEVGHRARLMSACICIAGCGGWCAGAPLILFDCV